MRKSSLEFTAEDEALLVTSECTYCVHRYGNDFISGCKAFPGGIPEKILRMEHDHRKPYPGDKGIRFTPKPDVVNRLEIVVDKEVVPHRTGARLKLET